MPPAIAAASDGLLILRGVDEIEGEVPDDGHVLGAEAIPHPGLVVVEGDVGDSVQAVLDALVPLHGGFDRLNGGYVGRPAARIEALGRKAGFDPERALRAWVATGPSGALQPR